jgi:hypothetical protein
MQAIPFIDPHQYGGFDSAARDELRALFDCEVHDFAEMSFSML